MRTGCVLSVNQALFLGFVNVVSNGPPVALASTALLGPLVQGVTGACEQNTGSHTHTHRVISTGQLQAPEVVAACNTPAQDVVVDTNQAHRGRHDGEKTITQGTNCCCFGVFEWRRYALIARFKCRRILKNAMPGAGGDGTRCARSTEPGSAHRGACQPASPQPPQLCDLWPCQSPCGAGSSAMCGSVCSVQQGGCSGLHAELCPSSYVHDINQSHLLLMLLR